MTWVIWLFVILAVVGIVGQIVEERMRKTRVLPTMGTPEQMEISEFDQRWIHVVKVLRDHSVIEKPGELPRDGSPTVIAVDPGEVDEVIRRLTNLGVAVRRGSGPVDRDLGRLDHEEGP